MIRLFVLLFALPIACNVIAETLDPRIAGTVIFSACLFLIAIIGLWTGKREN